MHFDQNIIFIIIAAIIGISRLVSRISEESKKQSQRRRQPPQGPPPQPEISTAHSANATENRRRARPGILGSAGPAGGSSATAESTAARTNSTAATCAGPAAGINAALRQTGIPYLEGTSQGDRGIAATRKSRAALKSGASSVPPPVPAEANEPGTWIEQAQGQTAVPTKIAIARTDDQPSVRASADTVWKQALRSPDAARTAIILREIFGPPRGVQSSNFVFETL